MTYENYIDLKDIKKILIIKCRHLGDVLLATPVFYNLKKYTNAKVDAYIYQESFDVIKNNINIDEIITFDRKIKKFSFFKRLFFEFRILNKIKKKKYDLVINLTEGDRGAIAAFFSKAKYKIGFDPQKKGFFLKEKIFSHIVKSPNTKRHTVEKNLDALRKIGLTIKERDKIVSFHIPEYINEETRNLLLKNNISPDEYILIHPTSRWRFKCFDRFSQIIDHFMKKNEKIIIVSGNTSFEIECVDEILKNTENSSSIVNLAGKINIETLAAFIKMSKNFYCLDSFAFHLANAIKAKVTAFFGPTCDVTWGIWKNERAKIVKSNISCRPCNLDGCGGSKISECMKEIKLDFLDK